MLKKHITIINIAIFVLVAVFLVAILMKVFLTGKKPSVPQIVNVNPQIEKQEKDIFSNLSLETKEKIKIEQQKIRSLRGVVEKIEDRILFVKVASGELKDKVYQIKAVSEARVRQTKIDAKTGIPTISDFSFAQIKINDDVIAWSQEDIKGKTEFETKNIEVIVE